VAGTTRWVYDEASGLLWKKIDAANQEVAYDYNTRGQTAQRTWARLKPGSTTERVTTTYNYFAGTGELESTTYNDTTPAVHYTYTRSGQLASVVDDFIGTRNFIYNATQPLQLDGVDLGGFYGNRVLTQQYDSVHRPVGFMLGTTANLAGDLTQTHTYNTLGRFDHLDSVSSAQESRNFSYNYTPNSALIGGYSSGSFATTRTYEAHRNLLDQPRFHVEQHLTDALRVHLQRAWAARHRQAIRFCRLGVQRLRRLHLSPIQLQRPWRTDQRSRLSR